MVLQYTEYRIWVMGLFEECVPVTGLPRLCYAQKPMPTSDVRLDPEFWRPVFTPRKFPFIKEFFL